MAIPLGNKKRSSGGNNIWIPTPVDPNVQPVYEVSDPDYNIFEDPALASRDQDFLQRYLANMDEDEEIYSQLEYGKYGDNISDAEYRAAILSDKSLYEDILNMDFDIGDIRYYSRVGGASETFRLRDIEIGGKRYSSKDLKNLGIDIPAFSQSKSYRDRAAKELIGNLKNSDLIFDISDKSIKKIDSDLKGSYFTKAVQEKGLGNFIKGLDAEAQDELISGTEGYRSYLTDIGSKSYGMMETEYQDVLSNMDNMFTNVIDETNFMIPDEDEEGMFIS